MNILLVRVKPPRESINLQSFMICEPLELEYVAGALQRDGHSVRLIDMLLERKSFSKFLDRDYDMVCFTAYINLVGVVRAYAQTVKKCCPNAMTVVGGVHAEVVPEDFMHPSIDKIIFANGIETICSLANGVTDPRGCYAKNKSKPEQHNIPVTWPDRMITKEYRKHYNYIYHENCATIKTSYGCPYQCKFCFCTQICSYKERSLEDVIGELAQIEEKNVFIVDDDFLFSRDRLKEFCRLLDLHGISKRYIAFGRADFIAENEDIILLLRSHGFDAFFVGLESFREEELDDMNKLTSVKMNLKAVEILENNGLDCYSGLITGEDWRKADFDALILHLKRFRHPMINLQPITPMPGTPLFAEYSYPLLIKRERYALWDMAHIVFKPLHMSKRRYYYHLLRVYMNASVGREERRYIKEKYGQKTYKRVRAGAIKIFLQYVSLIIAPK